MKKLNKQSPLFRVVKLYIKTYKIAFFFSTFFILLTALGSIAAPMVLQEVIKIVKNAATFASEEAKAAALSQINIHVTFLVGAYLISISAGFGYSQINAFTGQKFLAEMRERLFTHMEDLPIRYFDTHDKGDIMSVYINDIDTVRELISQSIPQVMTFTLTVLSVSIVMLMTSIWLFLIVVLGVIVMFNATKVVGGKSSKNFIAQQALIGKEEGYIEEMMNGLKVIKSFCHEEEAFDNFVKINNEFADVSYKAHSNSNMLGPILGNIGNFLYVICAVVGTLFFIYQVPNLTVTSFVAMPIEAVIALLPMVRQLSHASAQMAQQINTVALAIGGCNRVMNIVDAEVEVDDGYVTLVRAKKDEHGHIVECDEKEATIWAWKNPHKDGQGEIVYTELKGGIVLEDVDFGYEEDKMVLHNISLYAKPGQKVAFVGATGAGKTTITNLLNRFYDIADGKIRYDGININKIKKADLRKSLGVVLQDTNLFSGTIMENIRYGKLEATDEECIAAAKLANADSFISRLPQGYETMLTNDGANLSQGQRQLLSIARSAVRNAPVLILDEATSSIDTRTESIVTEGMDNLMHGRTVFVIAHRLSTIQNSDVIMVLDHGRIIERGSHDELIALKGVYYELYTGAFELE